MGSTGSPPGYRRGTEPERIVAVLIFVGLVIGFFAGLVYLWKMLAKWSANSKPTPNGPFVPPQDLGSHHAHRKCWHGDRVRVPRELGPGLALLHVCFGWEGLTSDAQAPPGSAAICAAWPAPMNGVSAM